MIHASGEDYLEAVLVLQKNHGAVRSIDVARRVGVSKASVSYAVSALREGGFLTVDMDANEVIIRLTREDFASEEEFLKWKSWSDGNYHTEDNQDVVEGKHNTSIDDLSEAALSIPAIDVVMERQHEKSERRRVASAMVSQIRDKLTETQFRRLWMYYVDGMTVDEIGRIEGIRHQNISKSIGSAMKKIKKFFP